MINKSKQLLAMAMEMTANGYTDVRVNQSGEVLGLPDLTLDLVGQRRGKTLIVEVADPDRSEEESLRRFEVISEHIRDKPKVELQIRFYDTAADMVKAWVSLRRKIAKKIKAGEDVTAHEGVLDMMDSLKKSFFGQ